MKIWFNRWFTTVYHYINMIRNNPENRKFIIYGTHSYKDALYLQNCDFAFSEPEVDGEEYIQFCLDFCKKHGIDIFVPRKENVLISKNLREFEKIGVKVLVCPDPELMELMDNKAWMYRSILEKQSAGKSLVPIPDYKVVNNLSQFDEAYQWLKSKGHQVCIKPVIGEGASGFRILKDEIDHIEQLMNQGTSYKVPVKYIREILSQQGSFPDMLVMEYLDGPEYSIDCLAGNGSLHAVIPRMKGEGRIRELIEDQDLIKMSEDIYKEYPVPFIFNIQVKFHDGVPKLLELNPRMSGGLHISCLSGVNFPYLAIKLLLNEKIEMIKPSFGIRASHLEQEIIMNEISKSS